MLERIDSWVLERCTVFSHWLQRNTGLTNFFVAKMGVFISTFSCIYGITGYFFHFSGLEVSLGELSLKLIGVMTMYYLLHPLNENEDRVYSGKAFFGSLMPVPAIRLLYLFLSFMIFPAIIQGETFSRILSKEVFSVGIAIYGYFSSITPLPPGRSKIGQMVDAFLGSFKKPVTVQSFSTPRQFF